MRHGSSPSPAASDVPAPEVLESLRIQVRHLRNDYELTRSEYEAAARGYLDALTHVERQKIELEDSNRRLRESDRRSAAQRSAIAKLVVDRDVVVGDLARAAERLTEAAAATLGVARASVWLFSEDGTELRCLTLFAADRMARDSGALLSLREAPRYVEALQVENRIRADDAQADPRTIELAKSYLIPLGISSMLDAGVLIEGKLIGVVCIEHIGLRRVWHADEELFVGTLAALVAQLRVNAERKRAEEELREANLRLEASMARANQLAQQAQQASLAKGRFLMQMSHEIRTPMNAVLGMADMLEESPLDPDQRHFLGILQSAGTHLLGVIDDILDHSKLETHSIQLEDRPFDIHQMAEKCAQLIAVKALEKALEIAYCVAPDVPRFLQGDELRLRQVILNLMGNAIKFTEAGSVSLSLERTEGDRLRLTVRDTGIGIPQDQLQRIFERFYQTDLSVARRHGGTGLGLTITRDIVELMGGEIHVSSVVGQGSVFAVVVPLRPADPARAAVRPADASREDRTSPVHLPPMSLLLVEDVDVNRDMVRYFLRPHPVEIVEALNGREAVEHCARRRFDLVLMDVEMPEMDGIAATRRIRDDERQAALPPVPIFALTAHAMAEMAEECLAAGVQQVITKPVRKKALLEAIRAVMGQTGPSERTDPPISTGGEGKDSSLSPPPVDWTRLVREFDGDAALAMQMLQTWRATLPAKLTGVRDALGLRDLETVRRTAHALKGAAANLAADPLARAAGALESAARAADADACRRSLPPLQMACDALSVHLTRSDPTFPPEAAP